LDWDKRYSAADGYLFGEQPNAFLAQQKALIKPGMKILAVADGEGRNGVWLAEQGAHVVSTDYAASALEKARTLAASRQVELDLQQVDLGNWDWPEAAYDMVVAIFIQFAAPDERTAIFEGMKRALKPGGILLLEGYRPEQIGYGTGGPKAAENMYDEAMLREAFSDFEIKTLSAYDAHIEEGKGHSGMSALIDLIAVKPQSK
jgi:cyclopropane fatty-acyl-phospholipid synthase-like methyltransferase